MFIFRLFPFRVENENTGEALSLWHLTSSAPSAPLIVEKTEFGPEVKLSNPETTTDNRQRSFVLRRHAHTGPLLPLQLVPAAIASAVCLLLCKVFIQFLHQNKVEGTIRTFSMCCYKIWSFYPWSLPFKIHKPCSHHAFIGYGLMVWVRVSWS